MESKNARLVDALNQLQMWLIIAVVCFVWFYWVFSAKPSLQEIEREIKKAATKEQVENLADEVKTLEQMIREQMANPEKWPRLHHQMKALSPLL